VVAKLLAPDPTARYDTARGIREDLERASAGRETFAESQGWPLRAHDEAATRRTRAPLDVEPEATRRTSAPSVLPPPIPSTPPTPPPEAPRPPAVRPRKRRRWLRLLVPAALLLIVLGSIRSEMQVEAAAERLAASIPTRELDELADAWERHAELTRRGFSGRRARALERSLTARTEALANVVIENYRTPRPSVREAHWSAARAALARAVAVAPDDERLKAALRYAEGHLHRINGEAKKARKQITAQQEFTEAVTAFREAAELRPGWPDPFLGLARTFIYGLEEIDRGADALAQAEQNGHTPSDRESAQLGDGYRLRAETLARSARHVSGMPHERDYLTRAVDAYRQAIAHYSKAGDYANVSRNLGLVQRRLDQIEERMAELDEPELTEPLSAEAGVVVPDSTSVKRVPEMR
jgi:tetratricopeptide (TPR) repeat protein